ncbi:coproporphyrinogen dehydrogenase HemZ [Butyrivibrio sp. WCD2001]|uniref:coproporphyrinogen dehydrogenase HemZ n=1 Tax=Butyrivibrio sp. WCD2001 TaxID=1280681 RepID=UPI0004271FE4|nr:coproporphyrinogen dehydrogenase HemZ [Butyrivibrio sp. WCD2001]
MIQVLINKDKFKYDIHSLVKAFYPKEDVSVLTFDELSSKGDNENILFKIEIILEEEAGKISMKIIHSDGVCKEAETVCDIASNGVRGNEESAEVSSESSTNGSTASLSTPKNSLKQMMYRELSHEIGHELPWGSLTGIRPTRIPMQMLESGKNEAEIRKYMQETFFVSDEKTDLAYNIALREKKILDDINYENGYSIYLGIPFCPTTCLYCSFTSFPIVTWKKKVSDYISCLKKEIDYVAETFQGKVVNSVYIGGGTPTTLEPDEMTRIITYLREKIDLSECREFTVESGRPDSITREKLRAMKECGVDRISVNPQTMSDETLKRIGRQHTVEQFINAYNMAREEGFDNINMDIILGLPGETEADVEHTMQEIIKLNPDDLTVHSLSVKRGSRLAEHIRNNGFFVAGDTGRMMEIAKEGAAEMGLTPYYLYRQKNISGNLENTGYAREGKAGIYNILMMEEVQSIVALGAGTVTKRVYGDGRIERCDNVKDVTLYMNNINDMIERKKSLFT